MSSTTDAMPSASSPAGGRKRGKPHVSRILRSYHVAAGSMRKGLTVLIVASTLLVAGCGGSHAGSHSHAISGGADMPTPAPLTPLQRCDNNVANLLVESYLDMRDGYQNGLSLNSVMTMYGGLSPTFQAYGQLNAMLTEYVANYGTQASPGAAVASATATDGGINHTCSGLLPAAQSASSAQPAAAASAVPASPAYPTPTPEAEGPAGCPGSAALVTAWNAASTSAFHAARSVSSPA